MADAKGGIIIARSSTVLVTPPGLLGWSHLIDPDEYQPPTGPLQRNFTLNHHYSDDQLSALTRRLAINAVDAIWPAFLKDAERGKKPRRVAKVKGKLVEFDWEKPDAEAYVDAQLQPFAEGASIELPFMKYKNAAFFTDKHGAEKQKNIRVTDADGHALDLPSLRMGMKSVVQVLLTPSIYSSPGINDGVASISLKLQGLRIIKLEQYGGGGPALGEISEEDMALLGDGVQADDLAGYTAAAPSKQAAREYVAPKESFADLDDEMPF